MGDGLLVVRWTAGEIAISWGHDEDNPDMVMILSTGQARELQSILSVAIVKATLAAALWCENDPPR